MKRPDGTRNFRYPPTRHFVPGFDEWSLQDLERNVPAFTLKSEMWVTGIPAILASTQSGDASPQFERLLSAPVTREEIARAFENAGGDFARVEAVGIDLQMRRLMVPRFP